MHTEAHPLAGQTVRLNVAGTDPNAPLIAELAEQDYRIEDWQDRVFGKSWMDADGNPAAIKYAIRSSQCGLPIDNDCLYGKVGAFGHIVHASELGESVDRTESVA